MTAGTAAPPARRFWHRARALSPGQLLLQRYGLTRGQKAEMIARGVVLSQVASAIGSAVYYLFTQVKYGTQNAGAPYFTWVGLKDSWDRAPVHVQNLLHAHWFTPAQVAPPWWVTARHDARHVFIGLIAYLLIASLTIGLSRKPRRRVHPAWIAASPVTVMLAAIPGAAAGILLVSKGLPAVMHWGVPSGNLWVREWLGRGSWQLTLIGLLAGKFFAQRVFRPVADTIQLTSIEKKITDGSPVRPWWRLVYGPAYLNRHDYLVASGHDCPPHSKALGTIMLAGTPVLAFWLGYGIWLKYFSGILPR
jgi:hypothetical protein